MIVMDQVRDPAAKVEHEASTSKIGEDQLFYFQQRGIDMEAAVGMIINGFCREVRINQNLHRSCCLWTIPLHSQWQCIPQLCIGMHVVAGIAM